MKEKREFSELKKKGNVRTERENGTLSPSKYLLNMWWAASQELMSSIFWHCRIRKEGRNTIFKLWKIFICSTSCWQNHKIEQNNMNVQCTMYLAVYSAVLKCLSILDIFGYLARQSIVQDFLANNKLKRISVFPEMQDERFLRETKTRFLEETLDPTFMSKHQFLILCWNEIPMNAINMIFAKRLEYKIWSLNLFEGHSGS